MKIRTSYAPENEDSQQEIKYNAIYGKLLKLSK